MYPARGAPIPTDHSSELNSSAPHEQPDHFRCRINYFESFGSRNDLQSDSGDRKSSSEEEGVLLSPRTVSLLDNVHQIEQLFKDSRPSTRSKSITHTNLSLISHLSLYQEENLDVGSKENRQLREKIRHEIRNHPLPEAPRIPSKKSSSSSSTHTLDESSEVDLFHTEVLDLIKTRLQCIRQTIQDSSTHNAWTDTLLIKLGYLIEPESYCKSPKFSDLHAHRLELFLKHYHEFIQIENPSEGQKKIINLIHLAIGGSKSAHVEKILRYLKSLNQTHALQLNIKKFAHQLENAPLPPLRRDMDFSHRELVDSSDTASMDRNIFRAVKEALFTVTSTAILDPDNINRTTKEEYRRRILDLMNFIPNIQEIKMCEFLVICQSPRVHDISILMQSRQSTLLVPLLFTLRNAQQALNKYMKPLTKTSVFANELHLTLTALFTLDKISCEAWQASCQPDLIIPPNPSALNLFITLLTSYQESKTLISKILALALTGNEDRSFDPLLTMLRSWEELKLDTLTTDLWAIVSDQAAQEVVQGIIHQWEINSAEFLHLKHVPRTFFGVEDLPSESKTGLTEIIPSLVTVNREPLKQNGFNGTFMEVQMEFFGQLLSQINRKGFNPSITEQEQEEQTRDLVVNRTLASPLLTILLGFSTVTWQLKGRDCINEVYPDLNQSYKYLSLRTMKGKGEIHFSIRNSQDCSCSQTLSYIIYPKLVSNNKDSTAIDDKRPLAEICFDWTSFVNHQQTKQPIVENGKQIAPAIYAQRGLLRITQLKFTTHATQDDRMHIYEALHMLEIVMEKQREGRTGWLEQFSPRKKESRKSKDLSRQTKMVKSSDSQNGLRSRTEHIAIDPVASQPSQTDPITPVDAKAEKEKRVSFQ